MEILFTRAVLYPGVHHGIMLIWSVAWWDIMDVLVRRAVFKGYSKVITVVSHIRAVLHRAPRARVSLVQG